MTQSSSFSFLKKSFIIFGISILSYSVSFAEETKNVRITADKDYLNVNWDNISNIEDTKGYALQWSNRQNNVVITKYANLYNLGKVPGKALRRASFENNSFYYLRVYTYTKNDNGRNILGNGSKLIKWKVDNRHQITSEEIAITDPVITNSGSSDASNTIESIQDFSNIRATAFDNFVNLSWTKPHKLSPSEYDGYILAVSEKSSLDDPIIEADIDKSRREVQFRGLKPETNYYVSGYFYKNQGGEKKKFGKGQTRKFNTIKAIDRTKYNRASRNVKKYEKRVSYKIDIEGYDSSSSNTSNSENTDEKKSTDLSDKNAIEARINEINTQIKKLNAEKARLELKLGKRPSSHKKTVSKKLSLRERLAARRKSSRGSSLRARLKAKLAAKRAARK